MPRKLVLNFSVAHLEVEAVDNEATMLDLESIEICLCLRRLFVDASALLATLSCRSGDA